MANNEEILNCIKIFTGGSKINNFVGSGFLVFDENNTEIYLKKIKINNEALVFMAEMVTIKEALDYAIMKFENHKIFIVTDSVSSLLSIINDNENRTFIENIRHKLYLYDNIMIRWIKAHVGNIMNDRAEEIPKQVTTWSYCFIEFHSTKVVLKKNLRNKYLELWQEK